MGLSLNEYDLDKCCWLVTVCKYAYINLADVRADEREAPDRAETSRLRRGILFQLPVVIGLFVSNSAGDKLEAADRAAGVGGR